MRTFIFWTTVSLAIFNEQVAAVVTTDETKQSTIPDYGTLVRAFIPFTEQSKEFSMLTKSQSYYLLRNGFRFLGHNIPVSTLRSEITALFKNFINIHDSVNTDLSIPSNAKFETNQNIQAARQSALITLEAFQSHVRALNEIGDLICSQTLEIEALTFPLQSEFAAFKARPRNLQDLKNVLPRVLVERNALQKAYYDQYEKAKNQAPTANKKYSTSLRQFYAEIKEFNPDKKRSIGRMDASIKKLKTALDETGIFEIFQGLYKIQEKIRDQCMALAKLLMGVGNMAELKLTKSEHLLSYDMSNFIIGKDKINLNIISVINNFAYKAARFNPGESGTIEQREEKWYFTVLIPFIGYGIDFDFRFGSLLNEYPMIFNGEIHYFLDRIVCKNSGKECTGRIKAQMLSLQESLNNIEDLDTQILHIRVLIKEINDGQVWIEIDYNKWMIDPDASSFDEKIAKVIKYNAPFMMKKMTRLMSDCEKLLKELSSTTLQTEMRNFRKTHEKHWDSLMAYIDAKPDERAELKEPDEILPALTKNLDDMATRIKNAGVLFANLNKILNRRNDFVKFALGGLSTLPDFMMQPNEEKTVL